MARALDACAIRRLWGGLLRRTPGAALFADVSGRARRIPWADERRAEFRTAAVRSFSSAPAAKAFLVYGANTDVGKTLACAALCHTAALRGTAVTYVKPVQTGLEADAAAVLRHCADAAKNTSGAQRVLAETLFQFAAPESPATAARKEGASVTDLELQGALRRCLQRHRAPGDDVQGPLRVIETAGGPLTPAPSSTPQADVYAPLRLPCILIGDPRLGGISATICAAESLAARGQRAAAVVFIGTDSNDTGMQEALSALGTSARIVSLPAPPPLPAPLSDWLQDHDVIAGIEQVLDSLTDAPGSGTDASMSIAEYVAFDRDHLWHPYTSMARPGRVWPVRAASGCELELEDGRRLVDGMSSWWCAVHGYNVPELNAAASRQLSAASHVMFGGLTHRPAAELGELLVRCTPPGLERVFLCDSGSISVEVALKMALQYWAMRMRPEKCRIATVRRGYHGDTFGAMSVCDPERGMHGLFKGILPAHLFAEAPNLAQQKCMRGCGCASDTCEEEDDGFASMEELLTSHAQELAAVILEPIVQGAGGMRIYPPSYLIKLRALCTKLDILLIFDEIATGFGRTGRLFAADHAGVVPDIMCVGKALAGGYCTLAATIATDEVARGVSGEGAQPLMHGPTYMANPLACAIGAASLRLLLGGPWRGRVAAIEDQLRRELEPLRGAAGVADVRVLGAIGAVELAAAPRDPAALQAAFVERGVWLRPFGSLIYCMPPYVISEGELRKITDAMVEVLGAGIELAQV